MLISLGTADCKYQPILQKKQYFDSPGNGTMVAPDPIDHYGIGMIVIIGHGSKIDMRSTASLIHPPKPSAALPRLLEQI